MLYSAAARTIAHDVIVADDAELHRSVSQHVFEASTPKPPLSYSVHPGTHPREVTLAFPTPATFF